MTPMGSRSVPMPGPEVSGALVPYAGQRAGDVHHLAVGERLGERVGHPVDRPLGPQGDQPQTGAVEVQLELTAPDLAQLGGAVGDRRRGPGHALYAVVLADLAGVDDHAVGAVAVLGAVVDVVDARAVAAVGAAREADRRIHHGEPGP